jgi:hypothetical protein
MNLFKPGSMSSIYWISMITMIVIVYFVFFKNSSKLKTWGNKLNGKTTATEPQTTT